MATIITQPVVVAATPARSGMRDLWRTLRRNRMGMVGLVMLTTVLLMAVFAPLIAPYDPYKPVRARIDTIYAPPSREHLLGTDDGAKDVPQLVHVRRAGVAVCGICGRADHPDDRQYTRAVGRLLWRACGRAADARDRYLPGDP